MMAIQRLVQFFLGGQLLKHRHSTHRAIFVEPYL
jgi:hypothetical protein